MFANGQKFIVRTNGILPFFASKKKIRLHALLYRYIHKMAHSGELDGEWLAGLAVDRPLDLHFGEGGVESGGELAEFFGVGVGEIVLFGKIVVEVVEFPSAGDVEIDGFPVSHPDGTVGLVAGPFWPPDVGIMDDERPVFVLVFLAEKRPDIHAVDGMVLGDEVLRLGEPEDRGKQIFGNDGLIGGGAGLDAQAALGGAGGIGLRPARNERHARAPFVGGTFAGFERPVVRVEAGTPRC